MPILPPSQELPDDIIAELVGILYTAILPIIAMGAATTAIGLLIAARTGDRLLCALAISSLIIALGRIALIYAYIQAHKRIEKRAATLAETLGWEQWYGYGSLGFAAVLGALCLRAATHQDPLTDMLVTGLTFGYGCGVVTRQAVRPILCALSLALGIGPAVIALGLHITYGAFDTRAAYAADALLIFSFGLISLETIRQGYRTIVDQITTRREFATLAQVDSLTALPNRLRLGEHFEAVAATLGPNEMFAVHFLDLDGFKAVNDTFGHPIGDTLLRAVAARLRGTVPARDFIARLGGDEFIVLQQGLSDSAEARVLADRMVRVVSEPYSFEGQEVRVGVSVGISIAPRDGRELGRLVTRADVALYQAKKSGRGKVVLSSDPGLTGEPAQSESGNVRTTHRHECN